MILKMSFFNGNQTSGESRYETGLIVAFIKEVEEGPLTTHRRDGF